MIFASPDFGAGGILGGLWMLAWVVLLVFLALPLAWGYRLLKHRSAEMKIYGLLLVLASGAVPLACCLLPPYVVRLACGNYPLGQYPTHKIEEGMTREEVVSILGTPHERFEERNGERWFYYIDSLGASYFGVQFNADGRVITTFGN